MSSSNAGSHKRKENGEEVEITMSDRPRPRPVRRKRGRPRKVKPLPYLLFVQTDYLEPGSVGGCLINLGCFTPAQRAWLYERGTLSSDEKDARTSEWNEIDKTVQVHIAEANNAFEVTKNPRGHIGPFHNSQLSDDQTTRIGLVFHFHIKDDD